MKLDEYVEKHKPAGLLKALQINPTVLYQWRKGIRSVSPANAVSIERATNGAVTRKDLRPDDWYKIWPELV